MTIKKSLIASVKVGALLLVLANLCAPIPAQEAPAAGQTVLTYQNRLYINPDPMTQVVAAFYFTNIVGLPTPIFSGSPHETTAYFTATLENSGATIVANGDLSTAVFAPGRSFNIYFNASPNRTWSDPAGFSTGDLVATYESSIGNSASSSATTAVTQSYILKSSKNFVFQGKTYNFRHLIPHGFTNGGGVSGTTLYPVPGFPVVRMAAGAFVSIGGRLSGLGF